MKTKLAIMGLVLGAAVASHASIVINVYEDEGNVVAVGSGSINTSALSYQYTSSWSSTIEKDWAVTVGGSSSSSFNVDNYSGTSGPDLIGSGGSYTSADITSGDRFGVFFGYSNNNIIVPAGYTSGTALSGTSTWTGKTLSWFGLTEGTSYEWTWGSGATADSATVNVTAVPEPSVITLIALFGGGILFIRRRLIM